MVSAHSRLEGGDFVDGEAGLGSLATPTPESLLSLPAASTLTSLRDVA